MFMFSEEHKQFLKRIRFEKRIVRFLQIVIIVSLITLWEIAAQYEWINTFITSSPSRVVKTILELHQSGNLYYHIWTTVKETLISFSFATVGGIIIAALMWWNKIFSKVIDPYLTVLNSLPKVALGPILVIWIGANTNSIIAMALLISLIVTIITVYNGFMNTDENKVTLLKSFQASKWQIFSKVVFPSSYNIIISSLKINISMSMIGVIMGEFLVSKAGIGYLIVYGSQVFNLNLVITGIVILGIVSYILYGIVTYIEKRLER